MVHRYKLVQVPAIGGFSSPALSQKSIIYEPRLMIKFQINTRIRRHKKKRLQLLIRNVFHLSNKIINLNFFRKAPARHFPEALPYLLAALLSPHWL